MSEVLPVSSPGVDLAQALARDIPPAVSQLRQGVVQTTAYTPGPPMVNVLLPGSTIPIPCRFFDSCFPQVGDTVWVGGNDPDMIVVGRVPKSHSEWQEIDLLNGWTWYSTGALWRRPQWRVAADGEVQLRGMIKHVTTTTTGDLFTLPTNFGIKRAPNYTNLVSNPSFEVNTTGWGFNGFGTAGTIAQSTARARIGTGSLLITWPTAGSGGSGVGQNITVSDATWYTFTAWVWVVAGPPVALDIFGFATSDPSTTTGQWEKLSVSWLSNRNVATFFEIATAGASTSGNTVHVDGVQVTATPAAQPYTDATEDSTIGQQIVAAAIANAGFARLDLGVSSPSTVTLTSYLASGSGAFVVLNGVRWRPDYV